jgi:hypothetical protein
MSLYTGKIEGGQGGKRGHSNMSHWTLTEIIKWCTRKRRRGERRKTAYRAKRGDYDA